MEEALARQINALKQSLSEAISVEMLVTGKKKANISKMLAAIDKSKSMEETVKKLVAKYGNAAGDLTVNDASVGEASRKYACQSCGFAIQKGEKMVTFKRSHLCLFCAFMSLINAYEELERNLARITAQLHVSVPREGSE